MVTSTMELTDKETNLIETLRCIKSCFGVVRMEVSVQNGQPARIEWEIVSTKESKLL